jgi:hypothetical protein
VGEPRTVRAASLISSMSFPDIAQLFLNIHALHLLETSSILCRIGLAIV